MNVEEYIRDCEERIGSTPLTQEMWHIYENPDVLKGNPMPNFQNMNEGEAVPLYSFYLGMIFGIGMANNEEINVTTL